MGLENLPIGYEYFSISGELKILTEGIYAFLTPVNVAIFVILTLLLVGIILLWVFRNVRNSMRGAST